MQHQEKKVREKIDKLLFLRECYKEDGSQEVQNDSKAFEQLNNQVPVLKNRVGFHGSQEVSQKKINQGYYFIFLVKNIVIYSHSHPATKEKHGIFGDQTVQKSGLRCALRYIGRVQNTDEMKKDQQDVWNPCEIF